MSGDTLPDREASDPAVPDRAGRHAGAPDPVAPDPPPSGVDPDLDRKLLILAVGGALGIAGIARESRALILLGIAVLAVGFLLKLRRRR